MNGNTTSDRLLTNLEAAAFLGLSKKTLDTWRCHSRHNIPYIKVGSKVMYRESDLRAWLETRIRSGEASYCRQTGNSIPNPCTHEEHTAGPWHIGPNKHSDCRIYAPSEDHAIARTYGPELNSVGVCELTGPRNKADARLISAAPELLALLERILDGLDNSHAPEGGWPATFKAARAAIAKARVSSIRETAA